MAQNFFQINNNIIDFDNTKYEVRDLSIALQSYVDIYRLSDNLQICRIFLASGVWWMNVPAGITVVPFLGGIKTTLP